MIPDTSGQDTLIASPTSGRGGGPKRLVWLGAAAAAAALIVTLLSSWLGSSRSVDVSRLRIAEVTKLDVKVEDGKITQFRTRLSLSFKYDG